VDLEYGPFFAKYRQHLSVPAVLLSAATLIVCMVALSVAFTRWKGMLHPKSEHVPVVEFPLRSDAQRRRA
jgi:hypothetical protein